MSKVALVVDDSMLVRFTVCRFLEQRGYEVDCATNGSEAMDILARRRPDLIVTDMQMPKMSGSEFITALKSRPDTAKVPIIVITGRASGLCEGDKRADFSISKDIDVDTQLENALKALGESPSARGQSASS